MRPILLAFAVLSTSFASYNNTIYASYSDADTTEDCLDWDIDAAIDEILSEARPSSNTCPTLSTLHIPIAPSKASVRKSLLEKYRKADASFRDKYYISYVKVEFKGWPSEILYYCSTDWSEFDVRKLAKSMLAIEIVPDNRTFNPPTDEERNDLLKHLKGVAKFLNSGKIPYNMHFNKVESFCLI